MRDPRPATREGDDAADCGCSEVRSWRGGPIAIEPNRILRLHRYTDPSKVRPKIRETSRIIAEQASGLIEPEARYVRCPVETCADGRLVLSDGTIFSCASFARLMKDATHITAFVLTLGARLDGEVISLIERFEPLDALFLESAGWLGIERSTREFSRHLRAEAAKDGLGVSFRMGPGYVYREDNGRVHWPLEEQPLLFGLFGGAELPVELMDSCAMQPKMSRSGIFGLVPNPKRS